MKNNKERCKNTLIRFFHFNGHRRGPCVCVQRLEQNENIKGENKKVEFKMKENLYENNKHTHKTLRTFGFLG